MKQLDDELLDNVNDGILAESGSLWMTILERGPSLQKQGGFHTTKMRA